MLTKNTRLGAGLSLAFAAALALSACTSGTDTASMEEPVAPKSEPSESAMAEEATMDPAANLVGPGCAGYADAVPDGAGSICPGTTWYVRIADSVAVSVFSASMVAGSIFANASSTGAKTVNSSPLSVSTRSTSGFS